MKPEEKVKALLEETKAIIDNLLKDIEDDKQTARLPAVRRRNVSGQTT